MASNKRRERLSKIIKEKQKKIAEERKRKEEESTLLHKSCAPDLLSAKPNPPLTDPSVPAPEEKEKNQGQEKNENCLTDYYPPSLIYEASYEEDAPTLVNNLIPEPTPGEMKDTNKMEVSKTPEKRRDVIEITDGEDDSELDWNSDYSY